MKMLLLASAVQLGLAAAAMAGDGPAVKDFDVTLTTGTLGTGVEANWRLSPDWGMRAGVNGGYFSYVYHDRKAVLHSDVTLLNAGLTADYYPGGGDFRLSAGARLSANQIQGMVSNVKTHVNAAGHRINILLYDPLTTYRATQNPVQPYVGAGYGYNINERLRFSLDFGTLYTGKREISVTSHAAKLGFSADQVEREIKKAENRVPDFRFYPVVQFGFKFQF